MQINQINVPKSITIWGIFSKKKLSFFHQNRNSENKISNRDFNNLFWQEF
jgi:hypothetical protein